MKINDIKDKKIKRELYNELLPEVIKAKMMEYSNTILDMVEAKIQDNYFYIKDFSFDIDSNYKFKFNSIEIDDSFIKLFLHNDKNVSNYLIRIMNNIGLLNNLNVVNDYGSHITIGARRDLKNKLISLSEYKRIDKVIIDMQCLHFAENVLPDYILNYSFGNSDCEDRIRLEMITALKIVENKVNNDITTLENKMNEIIDTAIESCNSIYAVDRYIAENGYTISDNYTLIR